MVQLGIEKGQDEPGPEAELGDEDGGDEADRQVAKSLPGQETQPAVLIFYGRIKPEADRQRTEDDDEVTGDLPAEVTLIVRGMTISHVRKSFRRAR